jgi:hypothetical protein
MTYLLTTTYSVSILKIHKSVQLINRMKIV